MHGWRVFGVLILVIFMSAGCAVIYRMGGVSQAKELHRIGQPAQGRILEIRDTGMTINDNPVVRLLIEVHPAEGEPYREETKALISRLDVPQFQPGKVIPVRLDPANRNRVSIDVYEY